jgi:hypothetical protein
MDGEITENNMADIGTLTPEQMLQQQQILRNQKMSEMLLQKGMEQPQGQMISGHYVRPSIFQNLAGLANTYVGQQGIKEAEDAQLNLAKRLRADESSAMADFIQQKEGRPAVPEKVTELAGPYTGNVPMPIATIAGRAAIPSNPQAAYANLYDNPKASAAQRNMAFTKMYAEPEEITLPEGATRVVRNPDGTYKTVATGGEKLHTVKGNLVTSGGKVLYSAPLTGEEKVNPAEAPLRTSFLSQATPHIQISQAYRKIESAPDTAAGDMSKIFGFMKILDPSSTVREGEYASAENARGVPDTVRAQYNKAKSGQRLTPAQRTQFTQAAGDLVESQKQQFEGQKKFFENIATKNRIAPESVIYDPYEGLNLQTTPPKAPKQPVNVGQQLGVPQVNSGWNIISVTPTK